MMGDARGLERARRAARASSITASGDADAARRPRGHASRAHDGYTLEARASAVLEGLGIPLASHRQPLGDALGRLQAARAARAGARRRPRRAAARRADQPPRHPLHPLAREVPRRLPRLRAWSSRTTSASSTTSPRHILDVDYGTITLYTGNYAAFVRREGGDPRAQGGARSRAPRRSSPTSAPSSSASAPRRPRPRRRRAASSRSRRSRSRSSTTSSRRAPLFRFAPERPSGTRRARGRAACRKAYGDKQVLTRRVAHRAARRAGRRSSGRTASASRRCSRSSIGNARRRRAATSSGATRRASATSRRTTTRCSPTPSATPLDFIWDACPRRGHRPSCAGSSGACCSRATTSRSGSARSPAARRRASIFARIMVEKPNVLVLDEPTNHLDLEAIDALVEALQAPTRGRCSSSRTIAGSSPSWRRASSR